MSLLWVDRMAVDARGEGDTVVFVHGLGGSLNAFTPLLPALLRQRCVRLDLPGAGRSHKAYALGAASATGGVLSVQSHAQAVLRVCEALGLAQVHLVGHSMGTIVALHVAALQPARVRSLTLFGALAEPAQPMREALRARAALAREQGLFDIAEGISNLALSASTRDTQPVTVAYVRETVGAQDPEGFARNCLALAEAQAPRLELVRCPTLLVNGDEDAVTPLSGARQLADRLAAGGAATRVEALARCGHWPMQERTADAQRLLRDFLERQR